MPSQTTSGKAFEFAIAQSLESELKRLGTCQVTESAQWLNASKEFSQLEISEQAELSVSARSAVKHLMHFEPLLAGHKPLRPPLSILLQSDQAGAEGDVRDIIISNTDGWEIGISAKHQHEAVKHSRLSSKIDFGDKWLSLPCSENYFQEIDHVFNELAKMKEEKKLWSDLPEKESRIYAVILEAFKNEIKRLDQEHPGKVAGALASYLIGKKDFYKIMKFQKINKIQVFNFAGTLNASSGIMKPQVHLERLKLPRRIVELDYKIDEAGERSKTTLELICDGGWQFSFRIHNASSRIEPSLKFDIGLSGRPNSLPTFHVLWWQEA